ncbi:MAG: DUF494 family protein [Ignavibacteria bacterium]|nr:DUF494 family protein [Ignavibacteria bacterium]
MSDRYTVERIMEIISIVIGEKSSGKPLSKINMDALQLRGFTESEISAALSWILERDAVLTQEDKAASKENSFRILHRVESDTIQPDAWGVLLSYVDLGFLTNEDVEQILERCMLMSEETEVGIPEIRALVAVYIMHQHPLPEVGSRRTLSGNESIN